MSTTAPLGVQTLTCPVYQRLICWQPRNSVDALTMQNAEDVDFDPPRLDFAITPTGLSSRATPPISHRRVYPC
jgi:hypothetical protein